MMRNETEKIDTGERFAGMSYGEGIKAAMETNTYISKNEASIGLSGFANTVCKMIYQKNGCDVDKAAESGEKIFAYFDDFLDGLSEVVSYSVPLVHYYELTTFGLQNNSIKEHKNKIQAAKLACELYYKD